MILEVKNGYPDDSAARNMILEVGRRMYENRYVAANDGNISCKVSEDTIWVTPTGVSKGFMQEKDLIKMKLDGEILEGTLKPYASESLSGGQAGKIGCTCTS